MIKQHKYRNYSTLFQKINDDEFDDNNDDNFLSNELQNPRRRIQWHEQNFNIENNNNVLLIVSNFLIIISIMDHHPY